MLPLLSLVLSNVLAALVLAAIALVVGRCVRRPAVTHALWLLVLIKLVTPPLVRVDIPWPSAAPTPEPVPVARGVAPANPVAPPAGQEDDVLRFDEVVVAEEPAAEEPRPAAASWPGWLIGVWAAGAAGWFSLAGWRGWSFARLLRLGRPASDHLKRRVAAVAEQLGIACPPVLVVTGRLSPLIWGVFRPVLVLPAGLEKAVGAAGWRTLIAHELAHVRRGDPLVRGLELVINGLYWWCPLAWIACRELREAEEQCCDAWVVRTLPDDKKTYATALVDVLDFLAEAASPPPLCSGLGPVADLKRRLTMILSGVTPPRLGRGTGLAMLLAAGVVLPLVPGWSSAQPPPPPADEKRDVVFFIDGADGGDARKLKEEIDRKAKELEELKKKLAEANKPKPHPTPMAGVRRVATPTVTIEISGIGKGEEVEALVKKIKEVVGGDKRVTVKAELKDVIYGLAGEGAKWRLELRKGPDGKGIAVVPPVPAVPGAPAAPKAPIAVPFPATPRAGGGPVDGKRLEDLERRLEDLMRKMEEMRREMHRPGPGAPAGRPGPGPMGGGGRGGPVGPGVGPGPMGGEGGDVGPGLRPGSEPPRGIRP
jgi:beta-lactamase regulating signal transducer with metallopeptidase domain